MQSSGAVEGSLLVALSSLDQWWPQSVQDCRDPSTAVTFAFANVIFAQDDKAFALGPDFQFRSCVSYDFVGFVCRGDTIAVTVVHKHYAEGALLQHSLKLALAVADGQSALLAVPVHGDGRVLSLLVVIVVVF